MKTFFITLLMLLAFVFVIYKQREKIAALDASLAAQTERADKLQADLEAMKRMPGGGQIQSGSPLSQTPGLSSRPAAAAQSPSPAGSGNWIWSKTSLEAPTAGKK